MRNADASNITSNLFAANQSPFSLQVVIWQIILALVLFAGLVNLFSREGIPLGIKIPKKLTSQPTLFGMFAVILLSLAFTDLPTLPLLIFSALIGSLGWTGYQQSVALEKGLTAEELKQLTLQKQDSIIRLELGSSLLNLASPELQGNLIERMPSLRTAVVDELGLMLPSICIKDNLELSSNTYRIYVRNGVVGEGVIYKDRFLLVVGEDSELAFDGIHEREPVFGLPAVWVTEEVKNSMSETFTNAITPVSVVMTHLSSIIERHASELLSREAVSEMIDELKMSSPRLVDGAIGERVPLARLHHILKSLLAEQVPIKDLATIVEVASDWCNTSVGDCVEKIRSTLRRQICENVSTTDSNGQKIIRCVDLSVDAEIAVANQGMSPNTLSEALDEAAIPLIEEGFPIVIVASNKTRRQILSQVGDASGDVFVLGEDEIVPEVDLQIVGTVNPAATVNSSCYASASLEDKRRTVAYAKAILSNTPPPLSTVRLEREMAEIRELVTAVIPQFSVNLPPQLIKAKDWLLKQGMDEEFVEDLICSLDANYSWTHEELKRKLQQLLISRIPTIAPPPRRSSGHPSIIALVGPTGVGKTTTIAKLVTKYRLQQGREVVLITADTYRIAAVEQLQQYADLFDSKLMIASTAAQMQEVMPCVQNEDIVLIDTAGRSAVDSNRIQETADILAVAQPSETHLVLAATTSNASTMKAISAFSPTKYNRIIVTKLDEAATYGGITSSLCNVGNNLSWFTDGQDVSTHIEIARDSRLIENVLSDF